MPIYLHINSIIVILKLIRHIVHFIFLEFIYIYIFFLFHNNDMLHSALSVLVSIVKNLIEITDYELGHRVFQTTSIRLHKPLTQRKPINLINDRIYRSDTAMNKTQGELDTQALSKLVLLSRYVTRVNL